MYSFEGEFRRKPQQNLAGASKKHERDELLHKAQFERQKREEVRKQFTSSIQIQAAVRSFLARQRQKRLQRQAFDELLACHAAQRAPADAPLAALASRLLFFYAEEDCGRLVALCQLLLRAHADVLRAAGRPGDAWAWRLPRLLSLCAALAAGGRDPLAVPLRALEVFTSPEACRDALGSGDRATAHLAGCFAGLVRRGYFAQLRRLLDARVPPLLGACPAPPTPLAGCLLELLARPLRLAAGAPDPDYSDLVLRGLSRHVLAPRHSEAVQLFVVPALAEMAGFPFHRLVSALRDVGAGDDVPCSSWLLFSVLALERKHFAAGERSGEGQLVGYLRLLAALTCNVGKLGSAPRGSDHTSDSESDEDVVEARVDQSAEMQVLEQCVTMLNDNRRVANLLASVDQSENPVVLQVLCKLCHHLLVSNKSAVHKYRLLYMLAFKASFLRHLWAAVLSAQQTSLFGGGTPLLQVISRGVALSPEDSDRIVPLLAVFCSLFSLLIATLHDAEFYGDGNLPGVSQHAMPFHVRELVPLSLTLKEVCLGLVELAYPDSRPSVRDDYRTALHGRDQRGSQDTQLWSHLFKVTVGLVRQMHTRDSRRRFCPDGHWISKHVMIPVSRPPHFILRRPRQRMYRPFQGLRAFTREELEEGPPLSTTEVRVMTIVRELPFVVAFQERVLLFQNLLANDKLERQGDSVHFLQGPSIHVSVRRNYLYEDAFDKLSPENEPDLRLKMRVQLVNVVGLDEAGVDGGGLFREFLSELLKTAFDPNRGFFRLTKDNLLYPNPSVQVIVDNFPRHYYFVGRMLGKALYENLLVELPFADFFLSKLAGQQQDVDVHHLASLDPDIYRNLLFLKTYEGDVADLGLDFSVLNDELGETRVEELKPGGANIQVTSANRIEYIHLMADYKLNRQIRAQCNAFRQGVANVIPMEWLRMFNNKELQVLVSGAQIPVDVDDLRQHTNYAGGYGADHPTIQLFWKVVGNFTDQQRSQLLKFVTSCSRPPLLGFKVSARLSSLLSLSPRPPTPPLPSSLPYLPLPLSPIPFPSSPSPSLVTLPFPRHPPLHSSPLVSPPHPTHPSHPSPSLSSPLPTPPSLPLPFPPHVFPSHPTPSLHSSPFLIPPCPITTPPHLSHPSPFLISPPLPFSPIPSLPHPSPHIPSLPHPHHISPPHPSSPFPPTPPHPPHPSPPLPTSPLLNYPLLSLPTPPPPTYPLLPLPSPPLPTPPTTPLPSSPFPGGRGSATAERSHVCNINVLKNT
ncbi:ubiquitin-protein ligase E3C isoform X2 [Bacillus rossius redtenbacheri]|uniref:ubiquitin-protein ligase E3C isoform X2 n=1 Tax=Bacillus rossius redtenbacheri TaxID=93214 RepID=UPI002FDEC8EB